MRNSKLNHAVIKYLDDNDKQIFKATCIELSALSQDKSKSAMKYLSISLKELDAMGLILVALFNAHNEYNEVHDELRRQKDNLAQGEREQGMEEVNKKVIGWINKCQARLNTISNDEQLMKIATKQHINNRLAANDHLKY